MTARPASSPSPPSWRARCSASPAIAARAAGSKASPGAARICPPTSAPRRNRLPDGAYAAPYALARTLTLVGAVAAEARPIDAVATNFRDLDGLRAEALAARRDGFVAKMAIHPAQVPVINEVFSVSPEAIARARAIVAAFEAAPGAGVVALDGEMLDLPHLKRAKRLLDLA